jgi:hypothetical protein
MDYDALKDQWSEVEDRDGVRLSWNTFPSSRMVCHTLGGAGRRSWFAGSFEARCSHRSPLHAFEREARYPSLELRACDLQSSVQSSAESLFVYLTQSQSYTVPLFVLTWQGMSIFGLDYGSAPSVFNETPSLHTTKTLLKMLSLLSYTLSIRLSSTNWHDQLRLLQSLSMLLIPAKKKTA